jgi:hypothetical protein
LEEAYSNLPKSFENKLYNKNIQQAKIYLKTYFEEIEKVTYKTQAAMRANNELTRHGLQRIDKMGNNKLGFSKRDREVREMEDDLCKIFELEDKEDKKKSEWFGLGSLKPNLRNQTLLSNIWF